LLSVNVGLPHDVMWSSMTVQHGGLERSGAGSLSRRQVEPRWRRSRGSRRALARGLYQIESYRNWQEWLQRTDFAYGQFGKNFMVEGLPDDGVYFGDRYRIGSALFEVTQPRVTCYRVGTRMNEPRMAAFLTSSGRPGFYFLVFEEGEVSGGDGIVKVDEGKERMSIAEINALLYSPQHPRDRVDRALQIQALSPGLRASFLAMFASQSDGNAGLAPASAEHPAAPGFQPLKVTAIDREATDVVSLTTQRANGEPLPETQPGQYSVLRLPGIRGAPLFRSYSGFEPRPCPELRPLQSTRGRHKLGKDFDGTGHLSRAVFEEAGLTQDAEVYLCGPTRFMADMRAAFTGLGVKPERIRVEIFNGGESLTPGIASVATKIPHQPPLGPEIGPLVSFARSGITVHCNPSAHQSALELAEACDVPVRWACRTGVCHNCESGLVSGRSRTILSPSTCRRPAICSSAVRVPSATSLWTYDGKVSSRQKGQPPVILCVLEQTWR
jgi:MOSC domain-containing protein YiiM/ferredoxin-NADP reductase